MPFFGASKQSEWTAIGLRDARIDLARVGRTAQGRPAIVAFDSCALEGSLEQTLARAGRKFGLKRQRCATLLASGEYQMLQMEAPAVPDEELREAVRWQAKNLLDYPVQTATLDVLDIPTGDVPNRARQLFAVAANDTLIGARMTLFAQAKVGLQVIDIPETAQRNIAALYEEENRGLALLAFDETGGLLTFTWRGELYLYRHIDVTLTQLMQASEAQQNQYVERISLELQRSLDHFDRQFSFISVSKLLVLPVPGWPDFPSFIGANVYVPVEGLDLSRAIDFAAVPALSDPARQAQCFHLIGMALREDTA